MCLCTHVSGLWCWHANAMCKHSHGSSWPGCQDTHSKQSPNAYGLILNVAPPSPMIPNEHIFTAEAWCPQLLQLNVQTGLPSNIISRLVTSGTNHIICKRLSCLEPKILEECMGNTTGLTLRYLPRVAQVSGRVDRATCQVLLQAVELGPADLAEHHEGHLAALHTEQLVCRTWSSMDQ